MKKIKFIALLILIAGLVLSCIACTEDNTSEENDSTLGEDNTIYNKLNKQLQNVSYPFTLSAKITEDGDVFNGSYIVTEVSGIITVEYSYEKLSTYTIVNDEIVAPDSYKTTVTGSAKIMDDKVIEQNGETINLSAESFNVSGISLSEANLTDVQTGDGNFSAIISSLTSVTGLNISATDATINISYTETSITKIVLTYSTSSYKMEMSYTF